MNPNCKDKPTWQLSLTSPHQTSGLSSFSITHSCSVSSSSSKRLTGTTVQRHLKIWFKCWLHHVVALGKWVHFSEEVIPPLHPNRGRSDETLNVGVNCSPTYKHKYILIIATVESREQRKESRRQWACSPVEWIPVNDCETANHRQRPEKVPGFSAPHKKARKSDELSPAEALLKQT